jgi:leader peptidase (prepilin peptidase) / N-methyltransferase
MEALQLLETSFPFLLLASGFLGLVVGSFLNVVIHRLPLMMEQALSRECHEYLGTPATDTTIPEHFNLLTPASRCPACGHRIRWMENIPIISFLFLRGKCAECDTAISWRYPTVETVTAIVSIATALHFGYCMQLPAALVFTWTMVPLFLIDFDRQILPDAITLPLLWLGLLCSLVGIFIDSHASIIGAVAGYLSLWLIYHLFRFATGKEGMGYGDFKLLGAIGAWVGWQSLPLVILFSSVVGAAIGITLVLVKGRDHNQPMPFGPFLAAAGWITLLWGNDIMVLYLD